MLKSCFIPEVGLLQGKMGLAIFFHHYSKYTNNTVYSDFANDLLDIVWKQVHEYMPVGFASGLTGIAWGIEYLIQNGFVGGDSNKICEEIDAEIMKFDPQRIAPEFANVELEGLLHYVSIRISGSIKQQNQLPFDVRYRNDLIQILHSLQKSEQLTNGCCSMIKQLIGFMTGQQSLNYHLNILPFIDEGRIQEKDIPASRLGLKNGLAGKLYRKLMA